MKEKFIPYDQYALIKKDIDVVVVPKTKWCSAIVYILFIGIVPRMVHLQYLSVDFVLFATFSLLVSVLLAFMYIAGQSSNKEKQKEVASVIAYRHTVHIQTLLNLERSLDELLLQVHVAIKNNEIIATPHKTILALIDKELAVNTDHIMVSVLTTARENIFNDMDRFQKQLKVRAENKGRFGNIASEQEQLMVPSRLVCENVRKKLQLAMEDCNEVIGRHQSFQLA